MFFLNERKIKMIVERNRIIEVIVRVSIIFTKDEPPLSSRI